MLVFQLILAGVTTLMGMVNSLFGNSLSVFGDAAHDVVFQVSLAYIMTEFSSMVIESSPADTVPNASDILNFGYPGFLTLRPVPLPPSTVNTGSREVQLYAPPSTALCIFTGAPTSPFVAPKEVHNSMQVYDSEMLALSIISSPPTYSVSMETQPFSALEPTAAVSGKQDRREDTDDLLALFIFWIIFVLLAAWYCDKDYEMLGFGNVPSSMNDSVSSNPSMLQVNDHDDIGEDGNNPAVPPTPIPTPSLRCRLVCKIAKTLRSTQRALEPSRNPLNVVQSATPTDMDDAQATVTTSA